MLYSPIKPFGSSGNNVWQYGLGWYYACVALCTQHSSNFATFVVDWWHLMTIDSKTIWKCNKYEKSNQFRTLCVSKISLIWNNQVLMKNITKVTGNVFRIFFVVHLQILVRQKMAWALGGFGNIHRKREAKPLSTLLLSTINGAAVTGWVMPQSVRHVRGILKFAFPATNI